MSKSPKFNAQCNSEHFPEAKTKKIELPDHDPTIFALLLEYLYNADYWPMMGSELERYCDVTMTTRENRMQQQAELYTMAGYYHLPNLQHLTIDRMKPLMPISQDALLSVSRIIYANNPGPGAYREHFVRVIKDGMIGNIAEDWIVEQIKEGGELAVDLYRARRELSEMNVHAAQKLQKQEKEGSPGRKRTFFSQFEA